MAENIENNGRSAKEIMTEHDRGLWHVKAFRVMKVCKASDHSIDMERVDEQTVRLLEAILYKDNFNRAYKRVKAKQGRAPELLA